MNHQKQLSAFFNLIQHNTNMFPSHISLYTSLFQLWSRNRFQNPVGIIREDVMQMSKINSKATYHKCMRDLQDLNFITYHPSFSQYHSSTVQMNTLKWEPVQLLPTSSINEQLSKSTGSINELDKKEVYIYNNNTKKNNKIYIGDAVQSLNKSVKKPTTKKNPTTRPKFEVPTIQKVKFYFEEVKSTKNEAERFYNYYSSNGWLVGGKTQMKDWQAAARNWILNSPNFRARESANSNTPKPNNLHVKTDKNYGEPL